MTNFSKSPLLVIAGPTASGKSSLALSLAQKWNMEIISVDALQVYKYLDIGTAKPTVAEQRLVPHHHGDQGELVQQFLEKGELDL